MEAVTGRARLPFSAVPREGAKVKFLELFFDLVFVLGFTQCTALMVERGSWEGVAQGMLLLALLWWAWGGYAWLTSVVDPEEGAVRIVMFAAMAGLLIAAISVPEAFSDRALAFAIAYGVVRYAHLALFALASRDDPDLRHSVGTLAASTTIALALLAGATFLDGVEQGATWGLVVLLDMGGPALFGVAGWKLMPAHFAERHGLIIILALGESIVVLGVGAEVDLTAPVIIAASLGVALSAAIWWIYFDVVALVTERRLTATAPGRERNALARDAYSYLHLPMVAGIVLAAYGLEQALHHVSDPLETVPAFALLGGVSLYLLAHVGLRLRTARSLNRQRLLVAVALLAAAPLATEVDALVAVAAVDAVLWAMIAIETSGYGVGRYRVRHPHAPPET